MKRRAEQMSSGIIESAGLVQKNLQRVSSFAVVSFAVAAEIDALFVVCLFAECPDNAPNGALISPMAILQPQNYRSNVESEWRWKLCSSATVVLCVPSG